jgi:hypothetical protein
MSALLATLADGRRHSHWRAGVRIAAPFTVERKRYQSLFSGPPKPPPPPPPMPMPDPNDPAALAAQQSAIGAAAARSGRASTLLSGNQNNYAGTKLGTP